MLLLWDRGFFSYDTVAEADRAGGEGAGAGDKPVDPATDPQPGRRLVPGQDLQELPTTGQKDRDGIVVRVIRYTLDDPQRVGHGEEHVLITNLLDEELYPAIELIILYHERWEEELVFDEQKTHQDPRRATKPAQLRSETPAGVIQEIYALSLGHFVIRSLMFEAAATVGLDPDRLSFTGCDTDQGSQFTSREYTGRLEEAGIAVSRDGRGRALDNAFVERLWRSVKYEDIYIKKYDRVPELESGLTAYFQFYDEERSHQSLDYQTPGEVYRGEIRRG